MFIEKVKNFTENSMKMNLMLQLVSHTIAILTESIAPLFMLLMKSGYGIFHQHYKRFMMIINLKENIYLPAQLSVYIFT